jgi:hypothetical protein
VDQDTYDVALQDACDTLTIRAMIEERMPKKTRWQRWWGL